jgi:TPP-dependent pyruvate/acetoin dehydrogenase alpha subunit
VIFRLWKATSDDPEGSSRSRSSDAPLAVDGAHAQKILGFLHLYDGEEAVSVGVVEGLKPDDAVVATYREHGQAVARGVDLGCLMAEMLGKLEGCRRGRGGSMHIFDRERRIYGGNAIVGGGLPLSLGVALADKMAKAEIAAAVTFAEAGTLRLPPICDVPAWVASVRF